MMKLVLFLHLIGASIWVGGHLYLLIRLMPRFVRDNDVAGFLAFEKSYEPLGMGALAVQIATGLYMLNAIVPMASWLTPMGYVTALIHAKFTWLVLTIITAIHARFKVVAKLEQGNYTDKTLKVMAIHVGLICLWSLGFVATGVGFR